MAAWTLSSRLSIPISGLESTIKGSMVENEGSRVANAKSGAGGAIAKSTGVMEDSNLHPDRIRRVRSIVVIPVRNRRALMFWFSLVVSGNDTFTPKWRHYLPNDLRDLPPRTHYFMMQSLENLDLVKVHTEGSEEFILEWDKTN